MKDSKPRKGDVILFISLLGVLILIMYGALSYLEDKQGNSEESIVITADQVQSFLWILGNYTNQQSPSLDNNGTMGYNESSGIQYYSSEVNYAEIIDPTVNRTKHKLVATVNDNKFKNCPPFTGSSVNLIHHLCTHPHVILFTPRNPVRVKINGQFYYSIRVLRPFKSTQNLKKALQRKVIVFVRRNHQNRDKNLNNTNDAIQFQRGHVYLASVNLANNLPFITDCDLKLDWEQIPYETRKALIQFFDQPSLCILYNYKIKPTG